MCEVISFEGSWKQWENWYIRNQYYSNRAQTVMENMPEGDNVTWYDIIVVIHGKHR